MTVVAIRLLFFCLVPVGLLLLRKGIRWAMKPFGGAVLLDMPMAQSTAVFTLPKEAEYTIWQKGRTISKVAVPMKPPVIFHTQTGKPLPVQPVFSSLYQQSGGMGRVRVFRFWAVAGQYTLTLTAQPQTSRTEAALFKLFRRDQSAAPEYFLEIKEAQPSFYLVLGVLTILLSAAFIIGGLVAGMNADSFIH